MCMDKVWRVIISLLIISTSCSRTTIAVHDFQRDLMFLLHDVARLLRVDADKRASVHGMTRAQWGILIWLERQPGLSQKELAELLEVEPITVARLIDRLEGRGMVERRPDPKDRRIWRLHLCNPAYPLLREINRQREEMRVLVTHGLDEATLETMTEALLTMKTTLTHDVHPVRRYGAADAEAREIA
jgi:MarR family transcriptional regulator for hemolysin